MRTVPSLAMLAAPIATTGTIGALPAVLALTRRALLRWRATRSSGPPA